MNKIFSHLSSRLPLCSANEHRIRQLVLPLAWAAAPTPSQISHDLMQGSSATCPRAGIVLGSRQKPRTHLKLGCFWPWIWSQPFPLSHSSRWIFTHTLCSGFGDFHRFPKIILQSVPVSLLQSNTLSWLTRRHSHLPLGERVVSCRLSGRALSPAKHLRLTHARSCHFPNASHPLHTPRKVSLGIIGYLRGLKCSWQTGRFTYSQKSLYAVLCGSIDKKVHLRFPTVRGQILQCDIRMFDCVRVWARSFTCTVWWCNYQQGKCWQFPAVLLICCLLMSRVFNQAKGGIKQYSTIRAKCINLPPPPLRPPN